MQRKFVAGLGALLASQIGFAAPACAAPQPVSQQSPIPSFVLTYAPLVYLYSQEVYQPSDIGAQLPNTKPEANFTVVQGSYDLNNLNELNSKGGDDVYLTSTVDITTNPAFLNGVKPDSTGKTQNAVTCTILTTDHGNGIVDAFYMYFYAFNWGGVVLDILQLGDHVGDWEHNMIRFKDGKPQYVWYSQHSNGEAFDYNALEKSGVRPIAYSGNGSHAVYATEGVHDHTIPNLNLPIKGVLVDYTDKGTLWDPTLAMYSYSYSNATGTPIVTPYDSSYPVGWLYYDGRWGDEEYPKSDKRQQEIFGQAKYVSGPTGPLDKQLNRTKVCPENGQLCVLRATISAKKAKL